MGVLRCFPALCNAGCAPCVSAVAMAVATGVAPFVHIVDERKPWSRRDWVCTLTACH